MRTNAVISFGVAAAMLGGTLAVATGATGAVAYSTTDKDAAGAARSAERARKAIERRKGDAVRHAEQAVALAPHDAGYRALLGQAYLGAGRFASAAQALADALALDPADDRAALNLVLAQTALGDWATARATLDAHPGIAPADRGLALALAGDPGGAVAILSDLAREPDANATARQNLALALALAGRWIEARAIASIDVSPAEIDARLLEWAALAQPGAASDQVASLLGVKAVADAGQPVALALARPGGEAVAVAAADVPAQPEAPVALAEADVAQAPVALSPDGPRITFAPRREIVQAIPMRARSAPVRLASAERTAPVRAEAAPASGRTPASGSYFVQLGAFDNAAVARDAWRRTAARTPALAKLTPQGSEATVGGNSYYRLAVGGFARGDADRLCGQVRAGGGRCFVRGAAGDRVAQWSRGVQFASR